MVATRIKEIPCRYVLNDPNGKERIMIIRCKNVVLVFSCLAVLCLVGRMSDVYATPLIKIDGVLAATDGDILTDLDVATAGSVVYGGSTATFTVSTASGSTKPILGTASDPKQILSSVVVSSAGAGTVEIGFVETGYTGLGMSGFLTHMGGTTLLTSGTVTFDFYIGADNDTDWTDDVLMSTLSAPGGAFDATGVYDLSTHIPALAGPYSLAIVATITHDGIGTTSFGSDISAVPEPATVALLGIGLVGLCGGYVSRKIRRKK